VGGARGGAKLPSLSLYSPPWEAENNRDGFYAKDFLDRNRIVFEGNSIRYYQEKNAVYIAVKLSNQAYA
jgi:hypothetical protein